MTMHTSSSAGRRWLPDLLLLGGLALAPLVLPPLGFSQDAMNRILVFGLFGIGFDLLFGYTGLLSFGQAAFFGSGGFVTAWLLTQAHVSSVALSLFAGTVAAALIGWLVGFVALRRTGIYFAMITVAIGEVFFFLENSPLSAFTGGENGLPGVPQPGFTLLGWHYKAGAGWNMYLLLALCFFAGMVLARRIVRSPLGHILVAIRDNPLRAAAVGHDVHAYKHLVFVIAAAYAGFAGGLLGILQSYMPPDAFTFETSGQLVMQTVIGGLGTLFGPLVGAAVWLYLRDFLQGVMHLGATWKLVLGVVFMLLVSFLRRGLVGSALQWRRAAPRVHEPADPAHNAPTADEDADAPPAPTRRHGDVILSTHGLTRRYGGLVANNNIDFSVREGEIRGIIGPNGAGKSTFFKMLTCEVHPSQGSISFRGEDITGMSVTEVCQRGLTKSYQVNQLFARLSVRENLTISVLAQKRGSFRMDFLRDLDHMPELRDQVDDTLQLVRLSHRAEHPVGDLAYGEKRRLEIGLALASKPSLLLLDEPLAGMSPAERVDTVRLLRTVAEGRTMIVIDHDMDALFQLAENITVLREGRILVEGDPAAIKADPVVREAYLGGVAQA